MTRSGCRPLRWIAAFVLVLALFSLIGLLLIGDRSTKVVYVNYSDRKVVVKNTTLRDDKGVTIEPHSHTSAWDYLSINMPLSYRLFNNDGTVLLYGPVADKDCMVRIGDTYYLAIDENLRFSPNRVPPAGFPDEE